MSERHRSRRRVLCFGDSNTWGFVARTGRRLPVVRRWWGIMGLYLRGWAEIVGNGVNGRTTDLGDPATTRTNGAAALPTILRRHAPLDGVVVMLGTNDLQARYGRTAEQVVRGLSVLLRLIGESGCGRSGVGPRPMLIVPPALARPADGLQVVFDGADHKSRRLPPLMAELAHREGCPVLDVSRRVSVDEHDGVHLDLRGHRALARLATGAVWRHWGRCDG